MTEGNLVGNSRSSHFWSRGGGDFVIDGLRTRVGLLSFPQIAPEPGRVERSMTIM